jgi:hypothetical protein
MRTLYPILLVTLLVCGACSYVLPAKKVECCESKAACCFDQVCCLPRYTKAAGVEPKPFTTDVPVYGIARDQDLEPAQGEVLVKKGWLSRFNPFGSSEEEPRSQVGGAEEAQKPTTQSQNESVTQTATTEEKKDDKGFLGRLWPF